MNANGRPRQQLLIALLGYSFALCPGSSFFSSAGATSQGWRGRGFRRREQALADARPCHNGRSAPGCCTAHDPDLALALQMSAQEEKTGTQSDMSKVFEDQSFVTSILNSLPGVDPNDPSVRDLLASCTARGSKRRRKISQRMTRSDYFRCMI